MADIDRDELHTLVDHIPEDDEPETEEERASVAASLADASPDIPFERLRRIRV